MHTTKKEFAHRVYVGSALRHIPYDAEFDNEAKGWQEYIWDLWEHGFSIDEAIEDVNFKIENTITWDWEAAWNEGSVN